MSGPAAHRDIFNFQHILTGTSLSCLVSKLGRKHLSPHPFLKNTVPVSKVSLKNQIFLGHGRDLTFLSCVQDLADNICPRTHF